MSTIEVVPVTGGSAKLGVYSRDHCPPHATCRDTAGRWEARLTFSFLDQAVGLLSLIPLQNHPGHRVINELAQGVQRNLSECRRRWWSYQRNNPAMVAQGPCCVNNHAMAGATIISADYDPATCTTRVCLSDGTTITRY